MKKWHKILITVTMACALSIGGSCFVFAADNEISVTGKGIVEADPDTADIRLNVKTTGKTAQATQKECNQILQKVTQAMLDLGVAKEDIVTTYTSVYPNYYYGDDGTRTITGYRANTDLQITTKDIANTGKYIDAALKAGASGTDGVTFSLSDESVYYGQALQVAVQNAGKSASSIAAAYQRTLGDVKRVTECSGSAYYVESAQNTMAATEEYAVDMDAAAGSSGTHISYGKIQVMAEISVVYAF